MIIYGAGLAGLLSAHMLRRYKPEVHEVLPSLPNNHEALLRFRTDAVSRATGIPFQQVEVIKAIIYRGRCINHPNIEINNLYSHKVTGEYHARSIGDLRTCTRYIAPPNFIEQMSRSCDIVYGSNSLNALIKDGNLGKDDHTPVISTIPMPALMKLVSWPDTPEFNYRTIWSVWGTITTPRMDVYQTIYYPDPAQPYYRASITRNRVIIEFNEEPEMDIIKYTLRSVFSDFGISNSNLSAEGVQVKKQKYGKLMPMDDAARRRFILAMTDDYRIYSVGRFATWRQILMDDVVRDVQLVEVWISDRDAYQRRLQGE